MLKLWRKFKLKWILRECPHFCRYCRHRNICEIGKNTMTAEELKMNIEERKKW